MFDFVVQLFATLGPIALAVMGFWVSIKPPSRKRRAHWMWAGAFSIVGIVTWIGSFMELRGTDTILGSIWEKVNVDIGPRLEFSGIKQASSTGDLTIQLANTRDIDAVGFSLSGMIAAVDDPNEIEEHFSQIRKYILENAALVRSGTPISRGMGVGLPPFKLVDYELLAKTAAKRQLYVFAMAIYVAERTPENKLWVTSVCAKIVKPFTDFQACQLHNGYFYSDKQLTGVP